jgi:hypothetical protein
VEISYGTMEWALNIIRGACPVELTFEVNPLYRRIPGVLRAVWKKLFLPRYQRRLIPFSENYNLDPAVRIARETDVTVISVGGFRTVDAMVSCVQSDDVRAVSLCRPLVRTPDWPTRIRAGESRRSSCVNCNRCTVWCDGDRPLQCYLPRKEDTHAAS